MTPSQFGCLAKESPKNRRACDRVVGCLDRTTRQEQYRSDNCIGPEVDFEELYVYALCACVYRAYMSVRT